MEHDWLVVFLVSVGLSHLCAKVQPLLAGKNCFDLINKMFAFACGSNRAQ